VDGGLAGGPSSVWDVLVDAGVMIRLPGFFSRIESLDVPPKADLSAHLRQPADALSKSEV
jgi:hypothetical protein